jgi:ABC-2 type transport system permease protein
VIPLDHLPPVLATLGGLLPAGALVEAFRVALGGAGEAGPALVVVAVWAVAAVGVAVRWFRWE